MVKNILLGTLLLLGSVCSSFAADPADYAYKGARKASVFDGTSDYLNISDNASISFADEDFSIITWVRASAILSNDRILEKLGATDGYEIRWTSTTGFRFGVGESAGVVYATDGEFPLAADVDNAWVMIYGYHDQGTEVGLSTNAGTAGTTAHTLGVDDNGDGLVFAADSTTPMLDGAIGPTYIYRRLLSANEVTEHYNEGKGLRHRDLSGKLTRSLEAAWNLDEIGLVTHADSAGSNDLTANGAMTDTTSGPGIMHGADFEVGSSQYFSTADTASLSFGDEGLTICLWVMWETNVVGEIFSKWETSGNHREYNLLNNAELVWQVSSNGADNNNNSYTFTPTLFQWYFIVLQHDPTGNLLSISVDNGAMDDLAYSTGINSDNSPLHIGALGRAAVTEYHDGGIARVGVWREVLSAAEITEVYNYGAGLAYADLSANLKTNLEAYWDFDGPDVEDAHGSNDLTNNNGVAMTGFDPDPHRHDPQSTLLLNFTGADAATSTFDEGRADDVNSVVTFETSAELDTDLAGPHGDSDGILKLTADRLSRVTVPDNIDLATNDFTWSAWIRLTNVSTADSQYIIQQYDDSDNWTALYIQASTPRIFFQNKHLTALEVNMSARDAWVADTWYHVAVTRTGADFQIWRDGVALTMFGTYTGETFSIGNYTSALNIGGAQSGTGFVRYIDGVLINPTTALPNGGYDASTKPKR